MSNYIDVILPIPLQKLFTYKITEAESVFLKKGMRVAVEFGKSKIYTALVYNIHKVEPTAYEAKDIHQILDDTPVVNTMQLELWNWIASYYMCTLGEIFRASLPSALLLESETQILKTDNQIEEALLSDDEFLIYEALQHQPQLTINQISEIINKKKVFPFIKSLIDKEAIVLKEEIYEQYKPKLIKFVKLREEWTKGDKLQTLLSQLARAKKQHQLVLTYFSLSAASKKPIKRDFLLKEASCSSAILNSLVAKNIFEIYTQQTDRIIFDGKLTQLKALNTLQHKAVSQINDSFLTQDVTLLHGITSSGKTEIYATLIEKVIAEGKQVLYLLPEIALTTQIIERLSNYFGDIVSVFHSKYSLNERVEVYNNVLNSKSKAQLILGARSSIFLPFSNLGLIIVDEEHETSYKQFDPAPRYHARDTAIVLAKMHQAKVLLGSATPSIESYYNVQQQKYGLVELFTRFGNVQLPKIELVDIKEQYRKKRMKGHFSNDMITLIQQALENNEQIILFQNRRGYSPIVECETCGNSPQCPNCDVSLTYHKYKNELMCHYCGFHTNMITTCNACGNATLNTKGFGTEQIELEIKELFPEAKVGRMDLDTTRGKYGYQKIIGAFQNLELDILVGTQMVTKGLDFVNVSVVGILNADNMLNFPDFRAHERSFQLMLQVAGRAGRAQKRGKVLIQTYNPKHQILEQVTSNDFDAMFKEQLNERLQFKYPPFYRIIKIVLKHKDYMKVNDAGNWLGKALSKTFHDNVLGPTSPGISRVRNLHIKNIILKIPPKQSIKTTKKYLETIKNTFSAIPEFRSIRIIIDVDSY